VLVVPMAQGLLAQGPETLVCAFFLPEELFQQQ
jgi:hypothetical protein